MGKVRYRSFYQCWETASMRTSMDCPRLIEEGFCKMVVAHSRTTATLVILPRYQTVLFTTTIYPAVERNRQKIALYASANWQNTQINKDGNYVI